MPAGNSPSIHRKPSHSSPSSCWITPELSIAMPMTTSPAVLGAQMVIKYCFALRKLLHRVMATVACALGTHARHAEEARRESWRALPTHENDSFRLPRWLSQSRSLLSNLTTWVWYPVPTWKESYPLTSKHIPHWIHHTQNTQINKCKII